MSPLFASIILAIFAGAIMLLIGLITRRKKLIFIGTPAALLLFAWYGAIMLVIGLITRRKKLIFIGTAVLLLLAWYVVASIPPNPEQEFDRLFGAANRSFVTDINTIKPTMMDGHFISFRVPHADFNSHIRPQFDPTEFTNFHFLRGQDLPVGWPKAVENASAALHKEVHYNDVLVYYDVENQSAYASVLYDQW